MALGYVSGATSKYVGLPTMGGNTGHRKEFASMANRGPNPRMNELPDESEVPPEARHTWRGLYNWLKKNRWDRGIPDTGIMPAVQFHQCSESCVLHDHES